MKTKEPSCICAHNEEDNENCPATIEMLEKIERDLKKEKEDRHQYNVGLPHQ